LQLFTQPYYGETALYIGGGHTGDVDKTTLRFHTPEKEQFIMNTKITISRFVAVSALALGLSMAAPAFAASQDQCARGQRDRSPMEMQHRGGFGDLHGIDLSADQVAQLGKLREEAKKQMREQGLALRDQHDALRKLVMSDAYTPAAAAELITKISATQSEMAKLHAEQGNKVYKLLTPEQRTKLQQNELTGQRPMERGNKR
jgi:Spy/CpxP family protein refolding chaperone